MLITPYCVPRFVDRIRINVRQARGIASWARADAPFAEPCVVMSLLPKASLSLPLPRSLSGWHDAAVEPSILARWWMPLVIGLAAGLLVWRIGRCIYMARYARRLEQAIEERTRQLREAQRDLAKERDSLERTLDSVHDAVVAADAGGAVVHWNAAATALTGISEEDAVGRRWDDLVPELRLPARGELRLDRVQLGGRTRSIEGAVTQLKRSERGAVIALRDVTDRVALEQEVARQQRLASIGGLAARVAHDFNNDLTVLGGTLDLLADEGGLDADLLQQLAAARETIDHAAGLTNRLATFSAGGAPAKRPTDLAALLEAVTARAMEGSGLQLHFDVEGTLPLADVDPEQIAQALQNLLDNAREHATPGGNLTLSLRAEGCDGSDEPPRWLELTVADDGPGMHDEQRERAFEIFYSTREDSAGLGLGVVHSTVTRHGGKVHLTSSPGFGTTVRLLLPAAREAEPVVELPRPGTAAATAARVLVMDDDDDVRHVLARMLRALGHAVVETAKGEDAIAAFERARSEGAPFDVVTLDLKVAGGLGGLETARALLAIDPDALLLAVSGYSDEGTMAAFAAEGFGDALAKPFQRHELAAKIEALLRRQPAPQG
jgi:PAS domain S-box-containing protein